MATEQALNGTANKDKPENEPTSKVTTGGLQPTLGIAKAIYMLVSMISGERTEATGTDGAGAGKSKRKAILLATLALALTLLLTGGLRLQTSCLRTSSAVVGSPTGWKVTEECESRLGVPLVEVLVGSRGSVTLLDP